MELPRHCTACTLPSLSRAQKESGTLRRTSVVVFFFQAEAGIRDVAVTGVQTCALPIFHGGKALRADFGPAVIGSRELPLAVTSFAVTPHALAPIRCRPAKPLPFLNNHLRRVSRPAQMQRQRTDNLEASAGALDHLCFDRPRPLNLQPRRQQTPAHGHTTHPYAARTLHAVGDLSQTQLRVFLMYSTDETLRMCCQLPAISSAATVHQTIQTVSRELRLILEIPRPAERHFVSFEIGGHRQG